jgi:hypothetical protein
MLSSSPSKIHEPLVIGVSPRLPDRRRRQELRNTRGTVGAAATGLVAASDRSAPALTGALSPSRTAVAAGPRPCGRRPPPGARFC